MGNHLEHMKDLALGIDLGTSKAALAVCDHLGRPLWHASRPHEADLPGLPGHTEQDAGRILLCAGELLTTIPERWRERLGAVGLTGQMHGVVQHDGAGRPTSPLVTWQDKRSGGVEAGGRHIPDGYGLATLTWWVTHGKWSGPYAATIHGLLAARLCGRARAPIDPTDLEAWGGSAWPDLVPASMMPERVTHGAMIGLTVAGVGLPEGLPVAAPLGDNQASIRGTLTDPATEIALTIGTGCQISAVVAAGSGCDSLPAGGEVRPFDDRHELLVAAPRCGGAAWKWLAERVQGWMEDLGFPKLELLEVYRRLDALGLAAPDPLVFHPHLDGERHRPTLTGSMTGLRLDNGTLGEMARALAYGIVANARDMLPAGVWAGRQRAMASGNALRRSALLRREAERALGLPVHFAEHEEEAATGAARVAAVWLAGK